MVQYLDAILKHSPTWAARRVSTGEYVEFNPREDTEWTYTFPLYELQRHYVTLEEWAEEIWAAAEAEDWEPVTLTPLTFYVSQGGLSFRLILDG